VGPAKGLHDVTSKLVICEEARFKQGSAEAAFYETCFSTFDEWLLSFLMLTRLLNLPVAKPVL
jgi:hypothetical protein